MSNGTQYTQERREFSINTPLGKDKLLLTRFSGDESVSRLFHFHLEMLSKDEAVSPQDIVGKNVLLTLKLPDGSERYFHGAVNRFAFCGTDDRFSHYTAEVVPWLWFLTLKADCRIFQDKTVKDILQDVFGDSGFSDFETSEIKGSHPKRDYCVQYRETNFNFVSRLMEEEGIFYYFRHEQSRHVLVLADQMGAFKDCAESQLEFSRRHSARDQMDKIKSWNHSYEYHSGKWAHTDYNFETPSADLMTKTNTVANWDKVDKYELYDYPGLYTEKGKGQTLVKLRMEEVEVAHDRVDGSSACRSFSPGGKFKLVKHHSKAESGKTYALLAVYHSASLGGAYTTGGEHRQ